MGIEKIKSELEENGVVDNPFDVMLYKSMEIVRDILFASRRLKNEDAPINACTTSERLSDEFDFVLEQFKTLEGMSEETVKFLRETSSSHYGTEFNCCNDSLLQLEEKLQTTWNQISPIRPDKFEIVRLGEDSDEYKRMLELRDIATDPSKLGGRHEDYLNSLYDVITHGEDCIGRWLASRKAYEDRKSLVDKFSLSIEDIEYMIAWKRHVKCAK